MPLTYSTPGVYVETFDADPQRIRLRRTDIAGFVGVASRGPLNTAVKIQTWRQFQSTFGDRVSTAYLAHAVYGFFLNGGRTCWVVRAGDAIQATPASVTIDIVGVGQTQLVAASPGVWGATIRVSGEWRGQSIAWLVVRSGVEVQRIDLSDTTLQIIRLPNGPATAAAGPSARPYQTNLLGVDDSQLQELQGAPLVQLVMPTPGAPTARLDASHPEVMLVGGSDGSGTVTTAMLIGGTDPNHGTTGLAALEDITAVSIVAVPDLMIAYESSGPLAKVPQEIVDLHEQLTASCIRARNRFALLDLPAGTTPSAAMDYASGRTSSMAAVYYPWLVVEDPQGTPGSVRSVPPSGHMAGVIARVDRRRGVHKPPANELIEGAFDALVTLDDATHGSLNDEGVNAIRPVPGRGLLVLGARTLNPDVRWRYVNVRRLFLMIEATLEQEMQTLVFEPNDAKLWRDIRRSVGGFLERLWQLGMLDGDTADDAYFVRCDDTTNPPWETDQGRVTCLVGLQPPYPAEFVIVRIGVSRDGVEVRSDEVRDV
jgi:uncharacterized protein